MLPSPEPACLVIADISGYTDYLAGVELDHAQDILADLIDRVVKALRPPFRLAKLEGDAAFACVITKEVDGSLLQDRIEGTYFAFRRRLRDIRQASSCECDACRRIPQLDLKFVVHHGTVAKQKMAGREELVGRDVILLHRLLKNTADTKFGGRAYVLYTDACVKAMGVDPVVQGLVGHSESIDVIGTVTCWLKDLESAWQEAQEQERLEVTQADALLVLSYDLSAPQQVVWEYATVPGRRTQWGADAVIENAPRGRRGSGTVNHCVHGKDAIIEEILAWRPYDYITARYEMPMPGAPKLLVTDRFIAMPDGRTRYESRIGADKPKDRAALQQMLPGIEPIMRHSAEALAQLLEAGSHEPVEGVDEPPLPVSAGRFASAPVTAAS
ncbi:MAG: DUF2652 domain-containing protein [Propylenella sp.]